VLLDHGAGRSPRLGVPSSPPPAAAAAASASFCSASVGSGLLGVTLGLERVHPASLLDESAVLRLLDLDLAHGDLLVSSVVVVVLSGRVAGT
jgi:hypothetical protein